MSEAPARGSGPLTWAAVAVATLATAGSLWLSLGMGLVACPLCFYQRAFAMSVLAVLLMGLAAGVGPARSALLALPSAIGGLAVAAFHVNLVRTGVLECPAGLLGLGPAPLQSLVVFIVLTLLLAIEALPVGIGSGPLLALGLGLLMGVGCIAS